MSYKKELEPFRGVLKVSINTFQCPATNNGEYSREKMERFFTGLLSNKIEAWQVNHNDSKTEITDCHIETLVKRATFKQMYDELITILGNQELICWKSKSQIQANIEANPYEFIKDSRSYLFFYKNKDGDILIFDACFYGHGWKLNLHSVKNINNWEPEQAIEIVIPQCSTIK